MMKLARFAGKEAGNEIEIRHAGNQSQPQATSFFGTAGGGSLRDR
jgi:hypothetical protein